MTPSLTPAAELAMLRQKYPDGLYCTNPGPCDHRLLSSTAAAWTRTMTAEQRESFVCAECRGAEAARQALAAIRADVGRRNLQAAQEARRVVIPALRLNRRDTGKTDRTDAVSQIGFAPLAVARGNSPHRGGRPTTGASRWARRRRVAKLKQRVADRDRQRAYRARQRAPGLDPATITDVEVSA